MIRLIRTACDTLSLYPIAMCGGLMSRSQLRDVQTYCMFVGYPRSGHSVIGRLLDAHPNVVIAHELGALKFVQAGFSRAQIFYLLLRNSRSFRARGSSWSGYTCRVPTQWQGRFTELRVIGDKQGQGATLRLQARPWLREGLIRRVACRVCFIHVVRNPYDNISTMYRRANEQCKGSELKDSIESYSSLCTAVADIRARVDRSDWFELRHELFVDSPTQHLAQLCSFLGVIPSKDYLEDCADVVFKVPHRSRLEIHWEGTLIGLVQECIEAFPFLRGYSFEG